MSTEHGGQDPSPITDREWRLLAELESDVVAVVDTSGTITWSSSAAWLGSDLRASVLSDDAPVIDALLGATPSGPLWVRRLDSDGTPIWLHATSVPRDGGGWVVQLREKRAVDSASHRREHGLDMVTGVAGRDRALDEVAFILSATPRTGKETAVATCSLDGFAALSARLGTDASDEVLQVVAGRIGDALRSGDLVARLDGELLLVVLRGVHHLRGAIRVANKIRAVVEDPIPLGDGDVVQTISIGVTIISRGESVDSVLERARGALLMAQESGGNLVMSSPPI